MESTAGGRGAAAMLQRRERILASAVSLFRERGFVGATTDEVAAAAGVTKRTLYRYVGTKAALLREIHDHFIAEGLARWTEIVEQGGTASELVVDLVRAHVRTVAEHQASIQVFFEEMKYLEPDDRAAIITQRDRYESILRDVLERGVRSGEFRRLDRLTTLVVLGTLNETYRWFKADGPLGVDQLTEFLTATILHGLRARASSAS